MDDFEINPYKEGWDCFEDGGLYDDNPFPPDSLESEDWENGYLDAEDAALEDWEDEEY